MNELILLTVYGINLQPVDDFYFSLTDLQILKRSNLNYGTNIGTTKDQNTFLYHLFFGRSGFVGKKYRSENAKVRRQKAKNTNSMKNPGL